MAIQSWACKETRAIFEGESPGLVPRNLLKRATAKLLVLNAAHNLADLATPPSNRLKKLHGDRKGQYSIRINDQYRICFKWRDGGAQPAGASISRPWCYRSRTTSARILYPAARQYSDPGDFGSGYVEEGESSL